MRLIIKLFFILMLVNPNQAKVCYEIDYNLNLDLSYYENCNRLNGDLIIKNFKDNSFQKYLKDLREVTGYILIHNNTFSKLTLPNLQLIHGQSNLNGYSFIVEDNFVFKNENVRGLQYVEMPNLVEISKGNVLFQNNLAFCKNVEDALIWVDIWANPKLQTIQFLDKPLSQDKNCSRKCPKNCSGGLINFYNLSIHSYELAQINKNKGIFNLYNRDASYCWSPDRCQTFTKIFCHGTCHQNSRCTKPFQSNCCNPECKNLCAVSNINYCPNSCNHYINMIKKSSFRENYMHSSCTNACGNSGYNSPSLYYNPQIISVKSLKFNNLCLSQCPPNTFQLGTKCLEFCPYIEGFNGNLWTKKCEKCYKLSTNYLQSICPNICASSTTQILNEFTNCEIIVGDLVITGHKLSEISGPTKLSNIFSNLRTITGTLVIQDTPSSLKSLEFFKNLRIIHGHSPNRAFFNKNYSNNILVIKNTYLKYLGMFNVKIGIGRITIINNTYLCHIKTMDWKHLQIDYGYYNTLFPTEIIYQNNNGGSNECFALSNSLLCDSQCDTDYGCWGPGPLMCLKCHQFAHLIDQFHTYINESDAQKLIENKLATPTFPAKICVESCPTDTYTIEKSPEANAGLCLPCHDECADAKCSGPGPTNCQDCRHYQSEDGTCVLTCPIDTYGLSATRQCEKCSTACYLGCTGPANFIGPGGCNFCRNGALILAANYTQCNLFNVTQCPIGFYNKTRLRELTIDEKTISLNYTDCIKCHEDCSVCFDSSQMCPVCKHVRYYTPATKSLNLNFLGYNLNSPIQSHTLTQQSTGPLYGQDQSNHDFNQKFALFNASNFDAKFIRGKCGKSCTSGYYQMHTNSLFPSRLIDKYFYQPQSQEFEIGCFKCSELCWRDCKGSGPANCLERCAHFKTFPPSTLALLNADKHDFHSNKTAVFPLLQRIINKDFICASACPANASYQKIIGEQKLCLPFVLTTQPSIWHDLDDTSKRVLVTALGLILILSCAFCYIAWRFDCLGRILGPKFSRHASPENYKFEYRLCPPIESDSPNENGNGTWFNGPSGIIDEYSNTTLIGNDMIDSNNTMEFKSRPINIIKAEELTFGELLGSGAFGTVHKGIYHTNYGQTMVVAIKTLLDNEIDLAKKTNEVLKELEMLCMIKHTCLLALQGFCMNPELSIVTEYLELGNLHDYLRAHSPDKKVDPRGISTNNYQNAQQLSSKPLKFRTLILWSTQIAEGMVYLEKKKIIHRDLAARNVLVRSLKQVVISDFGSARLLGGNDIYTSKGGKMPFKWLALETIETLKFTPKSDVWAYGVTLWEIFSYGKHPYDKVKVEDLCLQLKEGYRLPRPKYAPPVIYLIMFSCWNVDPSQRPDFLTLLHRFREILESQPAEEETETLESHSSKSRSESLNRTKTPNVPTYLNLINNKNNHNLNDSHLSNSLLRPNDKKAYLNHQTSGIHSNGQPRRHILPSNCIQYDIPLNAYINT